MLGILRDLHKDHDAGHLETIRATTGMTGIAFIAFTILHLFNGGDLSLEWVAMGGAGALSLAIAGIYSLLVIERTNSRK